MPDEDALRGVSSDDATVLAEPGVVPAGVAPDRLADDDMLADAMIARAYDTGADVVVLSGAGHVALGDLQAAASVRW